MDTAHLPDIDGTPLARVLGAAEPRTSLLELAAGERVPAHRHPDRTVVLHVLAGALTLRLGDDEHALAAGDVARFDGDQPISPAGDTDCRALPVLAPRPGDGEGETVEADDG